jgi:hypothetical protein|tara:strand:+ start:18233 stop:18544 length:312 start_codon:yes stop_codon:yes gene_type:complete
MDIWLLLISSARSKENIENVVKEPHNPVASAEIDRGESLWKGFETMTPRIQLPIMLTMKICHGHELLSGSISSNPHRETAPVIPPIATKRNVLISTGKDVTAS